jgi:hypothetical protein
MDAETILTTARSGAAPSEWNVWPLRRDRVLTGAAKWGALSLIGFILLVPIVIVTVPSDFVNAGAAQQSLATAIIMLVGALAIISLWLAVAALARVRRAADYWLIITPDVFIKAEPRRLFEIPLEDVADITLKGVAPPSDIAVQGDIGPQYFAMGMFGRIANRAGVMGVSRKTSRSAPSLAFRDRRDNRIVIISTDDAFDHLGAIEHILRERVDQKEDRAWRASLKPLTGLDAQ